MLRGTSDTNVEFRDVTGLLLHPGFEMRTKESHHMFRRDGIPESLDLQPRRASAKPCQVKQVRNVILKHRLAGDR